MTAEPKHLTHLERLILATFVTHQRKTKKLTCSAIANHTGYSPWTIYRNLKPLTVAKLVVCVTRGTNFQTNTYTLSDKAVEEQLKRLPYDTEAFVEHTRLMNRIAGGRANARTSA